MKFLPVICLALMFWPQALRAEMDSKATARIEAGVVRVYSIIKITDKGEVSYATGSGFILNARGDIATNRHVVEDGLKFFVTSKNGSDVHVHEATVVDIDQERDLAIIRCAPFPHAIPVTLCVATPPANQTVWSVGFPGLVDDRAKKRGFLFECILAGGNMASFSDHVLHNNASAIEICSPTFGNGIVARMSRRAWNGTGQEIDVIVHSARVQHGNSGGPLINADGNVIGINTQITGVVGKDANGSTTPNNEYSFASFITELNNFAHSLNVPVHTVDTPPVDTKPVQNVVVNQSTGLPLAAKAVLALISFLALAGIVIALVKKGNPETFTQYLRRGGNMAKIRHELLDPPGPQIHTPPPLPDMTPPRHHVPHLPAQPIFEPEGQVEVDIRHPEHSGAYALDGTTTDGNAIHLTFTDNDVEENGGKLIIGRKLEMVNLHIDDHSLSRQHATIVRHGHSLYLEDHASSNGTFVNGEKVGGEVEAIKLKSGSSVQLGSVTLTFRLKN